MKIYMVSLLHRATIIKDTWQVRVMLLLFHNRVINLWNALPDYIVTAMSVSCFKRYLLNYANNVGNEFFTSRYY